VALEAARALRDDFQVDASSSRAMERAALTTAIHALIANHLPFATYEVTHRASDLAMEMAEKDLAEGNYADAGQIATVAESAARRTQDWEYPSRIPRPGGMDPGRRCRVQAGPGVDRGAQIGAERPRCQLGPQVGSTFAYLDRPIWACRSWPKGRMKHSRHWH